MRDDDSINLSERQQILLSAYADDQCSFVSRFLAERLIRANPDAQTFISNLQATSTLFKEHAPNREVTADLWARIDQRIDAEERAALYLGQRRAIPEREAASLFDRLASKQALFGGLSGAAVAALVLIVVSRPSRPGEILPVYTGGPVPAQSSSAFHQAAFEANPQGGFPSRSSMEVDWMRGNGSLQLIQNPNGKSATIWVRKKATTTAATRVAATPTIRVLEQEGIDVPPLSRSK